VVSHQSRPPVYFFGFEIEGAEADHLMSRSAQWGFLSPSATLLKFAGELARPGKSMTLDLACGYGRNAIVLAAHGCDVICVDRDLARLRHLDATKAASLSQAPTYNVAAGRLTTLCADLSEALWPFTPNSFDTIINIHFLRLELIPCLLKTLRHDGYLYIESFGGQGRNYLELPRSGQLKAALSGQCAFKFHQEKAASQKHPEAVTIKALAQKTGTT
jgi:SAM-dependent methyltransferase